MDLFNNRCDLCGEPSEDSLIMIGDILACKACQAKLPDSAKKVLHYDETPVDATRLKRQNGD